MEMAQEKVVLLSYLDRNRLVKIPEEKEGSDLSFLEKDFRKEFSYQVRCIHYMYILTSTVYT